MRPAEIAITLVVEGYCPLCRVELIGGADELVRVQPQAQIARGGVPALPATLDVERPVEELLDTRRQARDSLSLG